MLLNILAIPNAVGVLKTFCKVVDLISMSRGCSLCREVIYWIGESSDIVA